MNVLYRLILVEWNIIWSYFTSLFVAVWGFKMSLCEVNVTESLSLYYKCKTASPSYTGIRYNDKLVITNVSFESKLQFTLSFNESV